MALLFSLLLLTHIIFDFYFQTEKMVVEKSFSNGWKAAIKSHAVHAALHGFFSSFILFLFYFLFLDCVLISITNVMFGVFLFVTASHFFVDVAKSCLSLFLKGFYLFFAFLLDQVIHVLLLILCIYLFLYKYQYYIYHTEMLRLLSVAFIFICAFSFLLKPSSIIVFSFFKTSGIDDGSNDVKITKSQISEVLYDIFAKDLSDSGITDYPHVVEAYKEKASKVISSISNGNADVKINAISKTNNAGRVIGYVERLTIFLFFVFGSVTAVVAVLAMKTALRFSDLKDDNDSGKAEYIMIGTFFSLLITIVVAYISRKCLIDLGVISNSLS